MLPKLPKLPTGTVRGILSLLAREIERVKTCTGTRTHYFVSIRDSGLPLKNVFRGSQENVFTYSRAEVKIRPLMGMGKIAYSLNMRKFIKCEKNGEQIIRIRLVHMYM